MEDAKEEIRARLPIEDVVGQYIELKRAGRNMKGHSPWGVDKTPSFMVAPDKGIWHDFSANKGGDIFTFVMEVEGISFREALEKLAAQAGVDLPKYSDGDKKIAVRKTRAREINELACKYYQFCLMKSKEICEYVFYKRNLNKATVKEFRIGYAPVAKDALVKFLSKRGYSIQEMRDAGVLNQYDGDLFRGRMMVPFFEQSSGNIIGFTARIIKDGEPKYLNTPETFLFNKSRFIFGLYQAKEAIRRSGFVVIVEGNMDVISSHQAGVKEAVATSGTAMTEMHLKQLSRLTNDIRLAYDGDAAGVRATERAIEIAGKLSISLSVISGYGTAKDPDELIQQGAEKWVECVKNCEPAVDWILKKYEEQLDLTTGPGKKEFSDVAMKVIGYLQDPVERKHYIKKVAEILEVSEDDLLGKKVDVPKVRLKKPKVTETLVDGVRGVTDALLSILVYGGVTGKGINLDLPEEDGKLAELELVFNEKYSKYSEAELERESQALWKRYLDDVKKMEVEKLAEELEAAADDEEKTNEILRKIKKLQKT